jgi:uncharacterized Fe-S cluster-containing MiaB family protein
MQEPDFLTKTKNFTKAIVQETKAIIQGQEPVTPEEQHKRISICVGCDYYDNGKCLICGCNMDLKTGLRTSKCVLNPPKW